jgi:hypothetical protein
MKEKVNDETHETLRAVKSGFSDFSKKNLQPQVSNGKRE